MISVHTFFYFFGIFDFVFFCFTYPKLSQKF